MFPTLVEKEEAEAEAGKGSSEPQEEIKQDQQRDGMTHVLSVYC